AAQRAAAGRLPRPAMLTGASAPASQSPFLTIFCRFFSNDDWLLARIFNYFIKRIRPEILHP
ncbi:hypothetical protein, partial [Raoultella terrigena]|uniref:hypothetical protein n=1 Tax=Raoultella terrigena TaxID=577 RepID=UPI003BA935B8